MIYTQRNSAVEFVLRQAILCGALAVVFLTFNVYVMPWTLDVLGLWSSL